MPEVDLSALIDLLSGAISSQNWPYAVVLLVIGGVYLVRKLLAPRVPFLASDVGGAALVVLAGASSELGKVLAGGASFKWSMAAAALALSFKAAGGYALAKKLLVPLLVKALEWLKKAKK